MTVDKTTFENTTFENTLILWWRFGKEHNEETIQVNPPELVEQHLQDKAARFRSTYAGDWRWFQVDEQLIVERWASNARACGPDSFVYYLLEHGLAVIENIHLQPPNDVYTWYIHICDYEYNRRLGCWIMKDLFIDVLVSHDNQRYHLLDLDEFAQAVDIGLLSNTELTQALHCTDWLCRLIHNGAFPLPEIERARDACRRLGWHGDRELEPGT